MIHYLLLTFEPHYMNDELFRFACNTFQRLQAELTCIRNVYVYRNCVIRSSNADLLVKLDLTGQKGLDTYLKHPIHRHFARVTEPHLTHCVTFDHS